MPDLCFKPVNINMVSVETNWSHFGQILLSGSLRLVFCHHHFRIFVCSKKELNTELELAE